MTLLDKSDEDQTILFDDDSNVVQDSYLFPFQTAENILCILTFFLYILSECIMWAMLAHDRSCSVSYLVCNMLAQIYSMFGFAPLIFKLNSGASCNPPLVWDKREVTFILG